MMMTQCPSLRNAVHASWMFKHTLAGIAASLSSDYEQLDTLFPVTRRSCTTEFKNESMISFVYLTILVLYIHKKQHGHIKKTVAKCEKAINVLQCRVGTDWGADRGTLMMICRAITRSITDYGCMAYRPAAPSALKELDVVDLNNGKAALG